MLALSSAAQTTSSISGTVKDVTGAVIPGAKILLVNQDNAGQRSSLSNGEGYFYFAAVQAGTYRLEISFQGFEAWKVTGIGVHPGDNLTVPKIALKAGAAVESIVVTAETAGVGLSSGEHSTLVTADQIGRLSTVGRDAAELVTMLPGFTVNATDASNSALNYQNAGFGAGNLSNLGSGGAAPQSGLINLTSDGANILDAGDMGGTITSVNMDQVQEIKVQTSNFGADQARGPVVISAVGKSGTSEYHGSLYAYFRNYAANANDWASNYFGTARPQAKYLYPGGSIGGPVLIPGTRFNHSKKLIFWAGFEIYRQQQYVGLDEDFIPSPAMVGGNLSTASLASALNVSAANLTAKCSGPSNIDLTLTPVSGYCETASGTDTKSNPITNGVIPSADIDPGSTVYTNLYPKANRTPQAIAGTTANPNGYLTDGINYVKNQTTTANGYQLHARVDENFSDTLKLYGTYNLEYVNSIDPVGTPFSGNSNIPMPTSFDSNQRAHLLTLNLTKTFSATITNEAVVSGVMTKSPGQYADRSKILDTGTAWADHYSGGVQASVLYGLNSTAGKVGENQIPTVTTWDGPMPSFTWTYVPEVGQYSNKYSWNAYDNLTKVYQKHSVKAGVYAEQTGDNEMGLSSNLGGTNAFMRWGGCYVDQPLAAYAPYVPSNPLPGQNKASAPSSGGTGNMIGQFLLGCPLYATQDTKDIAANLKYTTVEGYVTDEWKATSKLTLSVGVRFSHMGAWTDNHGIGLAVWEPSQLTQHVLLSSVTQDPNTWAGITWHKKDPSVPLSGVPTRALFISPRFSVAYDAYGNGKTVLRGGWGEYRSHDGLFYVNGTNAVPLGKQTWTTNSNGTGCDYAQMYGDKANPVLPCGWYTDSSVSGGTAAFSVNAMDPHDDRQPTTYNYNFTLDQTGPWKTQFELAYVGNQSQDLSTLGSLQNQNVIPLGAYYGPDPAIGSSGYGVVNPTNSIPNQNDYRPYPNYQSINVASHKAWSNYNSMQVSFNKQAGDLIFGANYTWSKALAVRGSWDNGAVADPVNMNHDYGIASFDRRHVFNLNYSWREGAKFHGNKIFAGAVNGWEVSGIMAVVAGPDLSILNNYGTNYSMGGGVSYTTTVNGTATTYSQSVTASNWLGSGDYALQPTVKCDPTTNLNKGAHQYVNGSCFGLPAMGTQGWWNLPYVRGPMFFKWDMSVYKNFKLRDHQDIQFRLSGFNFLNHPLISFNGQDPSKPLNLQIGDPTGAGAPVYTNLQDALANVTVLNAGNSFGSTSFKTGNRLLEAGFKYNF
jgi:hypothetical protein